jgi:hypothetical protein
VTHTATAFRRALCCEMAGEVGPVFGGLLDSASRWARAPGAAGNADRFASCSLRFANVLAGWESAGLPTGLLYDGLSSEKSELAHAAWGLYVAAKAVEEAGAPEEEFHAARRRLCRAARAYAGLPEGGGA